MKGIEIYKILVLIVFTICMIHPLLLSTVYKYIAHSEYPPITLNTFILIIVHNEKSKSMQMNVVDLMFTFSPRVLVMIFCWSRLTSARCCAVHWIRKHKCGDVCRHNFSHSWLVWSLGSDEGLLFFFLPSISLLTFHVSKSSTLWEFRFSYGTTWSSMRKSIRIRMWGKMRCEYFIERCFTTTNRIFHILNRKKFVF